MDKAALFGEQHLTICDCMGEDLRVTFLELRETGKPGNMRKFLLRNRKIDINVRGGLRLWFDCPGCYQRDRIVCYFDQGRW